MDGGETDFEWPGTTDNVILSACGVNRRTAEVYRQAARLQEVCIGQAADRTIFSTCFCLLMLAGQGVSALTAVFSFGAGAAATTVASW
jgi:hypothetical protein